MTVEVRKGGKLIGSLSDVDFAASPKTVSVKLTKAGRKAIKKGKKIQFSVSAVVPWGSPAKTSRALR